MKRFLILLVLLLVGSVVSAKQCVEYYRYNTTYVYVGGESQSRFGKTYLTRI